MSLPNGRTAHENDNASEVTARFSGTTKGIHGGRREAKLKRECDICIVGAGIVGMVAALLLRKQGILVHIYERQASVYPLPRAVALADDSIRLLLAAGLGVEVQRHVLKHHSQEDFIWRDKQQNPLVRLNMAQPGPTGLPNASLFSQPNLEAAIALYCEHAGVPIYRGWEFQDAVQEVDGRMTIFFTRYKTEKQICYNAGVQVHSNFLVAADGANSSVREHFGIDREDYGLRSDWLILDTLPSKTAGSDWPWSQICDPERPTTVIGGGGDRHRWEFMRLPHETTSELTSHKNVWASLAPYGLDETNCEIERAVVYTFRSLNARTYSTARNSVFLIGDSAHQMPPFIGQGLNSGIRDAGALAWRLIAHLRGCQSTDLLASYTVERRHHVEQMIKKAIELGQPICETDAGISEKMVRSNEEGL
ncbi:FAD/NAD(P)-binding domain-containing protein [Acaromyces ingoldii]|uniref:FAD/NAD(P)-binding domain-containing protein n=1 Tax=Acaromyces ingoldii TaxID=215250 RepID=A0A316YAW4_9BASI|nr:FAD/NAD(P)-binding domain-containing protein [Acaromyces ingoldii]PWN86766.1 FAD/NAD(P)-binding domain-containing protein [Acaromyces ingoldii]